MGLFDRLKKTSRSEKATASASEAASGGGKVIKVADFLSEKTITFFPAGPSKKQAFGSLIAALDLPDPNMALKAILAREEAGSTQITPGIALPHARLPGLPRLAAALGLCPGGVIDPIAKGERIKVFLLFLGPAENMQQHLGFLAAASALFQRNNFVSAVLKLNSASSVLKKIRDVEKTF